MLCSIAQILPIPAEPRDAPRMLPMPRVGLIDSKTSTSLCSINNFWGRISLLHTRAEFNQVAALILRPPHLSVSVPIALAGFLYHRTAILTRLSDRVQ